MLLVFIFTCEALPCRGLYTTSSGLHIREFAVVICCGYLPREFAAGICHENLPWLFAVGFCMFKQILFSIREQILFIWKQTFFTCEQNLWNFLYEQCFFLLLSWQSWATVYNVVKLSITNNNVSFFRFPITLQVFARVFWYRDRLISWYGLC